MLQVDDELEEGEVVRLPHRTRVRYGHRMNEDLAVVALRRVDDRDAALEPFGLAEAHRPKFYAVRCQVEAWERTRLAREGGS